jgi:Ca2+-binding EF-hand superfamily protein
MSLLTVKVAPPSAPSAAPALPAATSSAPTVVTDAKGKAYDVNVLMDKLRASLGQRGVVGIVSIGKKFRIIDDDNSNLLSLEEFKKAMNEHTMDMTENEVRALFKYFDQSDDGYISYDEFLVGLRGDLNPRRKALVNLAYGVLDTDKSGQVDLHDIMMTYDTSKHPEVIAGKKSRSEVLREFLDTFDGGEKDGIVTPQEFERYYANVSSSIDNDDYFELMIRNAWHISGGKGQYENTTCRRVLVTHRDGHQSVEEITNDFGMKKDDTAGMIANLKARGIDAAKISTVGSTDDPSSPSKSLASAAPAKSSRGAHVGQNTKSSIIFG